MNEKIAVGIFGASGRLGKAIASEILLSNLFALGPILVHRQSSKIGIDLGFLLGQSPLKKYLETDSNEKPDVWIDVSVAAGLENRLKLFEAHEKPVVFGTTGFSKEELQKIEILSLKIPIFYAANFSLGMALMQKFAREAALHFPPSTYIDLIETHHSKKKDAPSGSAIQIARTIQTAIPDRPPVSIHSIRSGHIVGEHTLLLNTGEEKFVITHEIDNRNVFAKGALRAAHFISQNSPGLYSMDDLIAQNVPIHGS